MVKIRFFVRIFALMGLYNLLLPLKLDWLPVYSCDSELRIGQRVEVNFSGRNYTAVVIRKSEETPDRGYRVLEVGTVETGLADISERELKLWKFISEYYLCTLGEVYMAAYPKYKVKSEKSRNSKSDAVAPKTPARSCGKPVLYRAASRTDYYRENISRCLADGYSALVLVPEVEFALNLKQELGEEFEAVVYDNALTAAKKRKLAEKLRTGEKPMVVIGARSALFLPFGRLGLVIVDEEQESSYKQPEPAPRYNGRDVACVLASIHGAQLVLGTFTPSLESLYNCKIGKYSLVDGGSETDCTVEVVDINAERRKRGMVGDFSRKLLSRIRKTDGQVSIIRSYSTEQSVCEFFEKEFPEKDPQILTAQAAKKMAGRSALMAVLNADSLFDSQDFRSDEKALQLVRSLSLHSDVLVVQCTLPAHPVYSAISDISFEDKLLTERKQFRMPPFTRIVDIKDRKTGMLVDRKILKRDASLSEQKSRLQMQYGALYIIDVDPL